MGIQYAGGTNINATFTGDTKQHIADGIETQLLAAGWTTVSGHLTANLLMQSAATPQTLAINVRIKGGTNCANISIESTDGVLLGGNDTTHGGSLLPAAAKTFRVVANKYQFFCFVPGTFSTARNFVGAGVPYIPSPNSVGTRAGWLVSDSTSDSGTGACSSWRVALTNNASGAGSTPNVQMMRNGNIWENNNNGGPSSGGSILEVMGVVPFDLNDVGANLASGQPSFYRWESGDIVSSDALLSWGLSALGDEPVLRAQMWDAIIIQDSIPGDTTTSFDSHNWICLTNSNVGAAARHPRGSVFIVIP